MSLRCRPERVEQHLHEKSSEARSRFSGARWKGTRHVLVRFLESVGECLARLIKRIGVLTYLKVDILRAKSEGEVLEATEDNPERVLGDITRAVRKEDATCERREEGGRMAVRSRRVSPPVTG